MVLPREMPNSRTTADTLNIAFAQVNPTVGNVAGNLALVRRMRADAATAGADLVVFPELVLVGYPPEDLVLRPALVQAAADAVRQLQQDTADGGPGLVVTTPWVNNGCLHNTVALVDDGRLDLRFKHELPNYGVFDEKRVFAAGPVPTPVTFRGVRMGLPICEDIWFPRVTDQLTKLGAELMDFADRSQRLAVRGRQVRQACGARQGTRLRIESAARLRQPGWRTGRTRLRRRLLRCQRRRLTGAAASLFH